MSADEIVVGPPMPRIGRVSPEGASLVRVEWAAGSRRGIELVDLAPVLFSFKAYRAVRDDPDRFRTVRVVRHGTALAWGDDDAVDMAATTVERLAGEQMSPEDFTRFLKHQDWTFDAAAAQLGISRRLVAYYAAGNRPVPRLVSLACAYLAGSSEDRSSW